MWWLSARDLSTALVQAPTLRFSNSDSNPDSNPVSDVITQAAIMRVGFTEMIRLIKRAYPETSDTVFNESCGIADLITTCYGGRNRKCAEAFVRGRGKRSFEDIEDELLDGQKLQGEI